MAIKDLVRQTIGPRAPLYASVICVVVLGLYLYWFAVADRYAVFLYDHLGTTPFDMITRGRYTMAGFVAAAIVALGYLPGNALLAWRTRHTSHPYVPPPWWQVWAISALPIGVGILVITMNMNWPTLPLGPALSSVAAVWMGLALALAPSTLVTQRPRELLWCAWIGGGCVPLLLGVRTIELPARGIVDAPVVGGVVAGSLAFALIWTALWLQFYVRRARRPLSWYALLLAGLFWSYLFFPLLHYWFFTPLAFRYIPAASNYFADGWGVQLLTYALTLLVIAVAYLPLRKRLPQHENVQA